MLEQGEDAQQVQRSGAQVADAEASGDQGESVIIRRGELGDIEQVRHLMRQFHEQSVFADTPFSDERFDKHISEIARRPIHMIELVAEYQGNIIGIAWASVGKYALSDELIATIHVVAVDLNINDQGEQEKGIGYAMRRATTFLRLFKGVKLWAEGRGAKRVMVHVTSGDNRGALGFRKAEKLLEKVSAQSIGGAFVL